MNRDKKRSKSARKRRAGSNYGVSDKNTGGSNIFVAVRVRPINDKETYISNFETAKVIDNNTVLLLDPQYEMAPEDVIPLPKFSRIDNAYNKPLTLPAF